MSGGGGEVAQLKSKGQGPPICWHSDDSPAAGSAYIEEVEIIRAELRGLTAHVLVFQRQFRDFPGQSVCTKRVRWGRGLRKASRNRLTFDTTGWNHYFRRADRNLSADVTLLFMGSSLLRIWNS